MQYKLLGNSGLRVSELCLGTMTFGEASDWGASKAESRKMLERFAACGGNFIDTANTYALGASERCLSEFIASDRDRFVLATKYSLSTRADDANACGNHRKHMVQALEASLKRLRTDYIDLYWVHAWDCRTPVEEVLRALDDMVSAGKILYAGISDTPAWVVSQANAIAALRGWTSFIGLQIRYNLIDRTPERDLLPMAQAFQIGVTAWGVLSSGLLTDKYNQRNGRIVARGPGRLGSDDPIFNQRNLRIAEEVRSLAHQLGRTPAQIAINWVRQQARSMIPIIGGRTVAQVEESMACLEFRLHDEAIQKLNDISAIDLGFPHDFLASERFQKRLFGDMLPLIESRKEP
jgi:aryl-alcohol dehydrogenase-like predicted oxidoreductase